MIDDSASDEDELVCLHEVQLRNAMMVLGTLASEAGGSVTVDLSRAEELGGRGIVLSFDPRSNSATVSLVGDAHESGSTHPPRFTHRGPDTKQ